MNKSYIVVDADTKYKADQYITYNLSKSWAPALLLSEEDKGFTSA